MNHGRKTNRGWWPVGGKKERDREKDREREGGEGERERGGSLDGMAEAS